MNITLWTHEGNNRDQTIMLFKSFVRQKNYYEMVVCIEHKLYWKSFDCTPLQLIILINKAKKIERNRTLDITIEDIK